MTKRNWGEGLQRGSLEPRINPPDVYDEYDEEDENEEEEENEEKEIA